LRRDLYPQLGKELAEAHCVVMEDTNVKSLVGKSYRELRMRLHDVAFGKLREPFKYQVQRYGKTFLLVNPASTSRTCAKCGNVKELALSDRFFSCPCCWVTDRDYNASLNILRRAWLGLLSLWSPAPCPWLRTRWGLEAGTRPQGRGSSLVIFSTVWVRRSA
jgi:putative transposase